jgi:hypothetical protein
MRLPNRPTRTLPPHFCPQLWWFETHREKNNARKKCHRHWTQTIDLRERRQHHYHCVTPSGCAYDETILYLARFGSSKFKKSKISQDFFDRYPHLPRLLVKLGYQSVTKCPITNTLLAIAIASSKSLMKGVFMPGPHALTSYLCISY